MEVLSQKYLFNKKTFTLSDSQINVITKSLTEDLEYSIKYEELGFDIVKKKEKSTIIGAILLSLFFFLDLFLLIKSIIEQERSALIVMWFLSGLFFGFISLLAFYRSNKSLIYLTGGSKVLELLNNNPSKEFVDSFIKSIHSKMKRHYRRKYAIIEKHLPKDLHIERFNWLLELKIIDKEEHSQLIDKLQEDFLY